VIVKVLRGCDEGEGLGGVESLFHITEVEIGETQCLDRYGKGHYHDKEHQGFLEHRFLSGVEK
jgi:hypothetical protein